MMKAILRRTMAGLLAAGMLAVPAATEVQAVSWGNILRGAINVGSTHAAVDAMDRDQDGMLRETQARTGVYQNETYQQRAKKIMQHLQDTGIPQRQYVIYVNPSDDINAFCTLAGVVSVNKGLMDIMDDDCLAFVLAHEISHGEHRDSVNGITKKVALANAAGVALGNTSAAEALVANIALQYVNNEVFTMGQEKNADKLGFAILAASPYNVGGAAAAMQSLLEYNGDRGAQGIVRIIAPNTHPRSSDRVTVALDRLHEFSGGHVSVRGETVLVNGDVVITAAKAGRYSAAMRAQLAGGKLARLFRDNAVTSPFLKGRTVIMGTTPVYTAATVQEGQTIVTRLATALAPKAAKTPTERPAATTENVPADTGKTTAVDKTDDDIRDRVRAILRN